MQYLAWSLLLYLSFTTTSLQYDARGSASLACDVLVVIDYPLFAHYQQDIQAVTKVTRDLISGVNAIYHRTVFTGDYANIYFRLRNIEVLHDFCNHCNQTQKEFLNQFTKFDYREYCVAILFTYRDFPAGLAGLAWRGSVCSDTHNTGFITFLNNNIESTEQDNIITLAHEMGHLLGATHVDSTSCGERDDYIMSPTGTNNMVPVFSSCSIEAIHAEVSKQKLYGTCFKEEVEVTDSEVGFCGDGVVQGLEHCDCGINYESCRDPCCTAGLVSPIDKYWDESARPCQHIYRKICTHPYAVLLNFGIIGPSIFILTSTVLVTILLCCNWRRSKSLFKHTSSTITKKRPSSLPTPKRNSKLTPRDKRASSKEQGNITREDIKIGQPFLLSTTVDMTNTKTCKRQHDKYRSVPTSWDDAESYPNNKPIIKPKPSNINPLTASRILTTTSDMVSTTASSQDGEVVNESTSFITTPLSGPSASSQGGVGGGYNPLPRRAAPRPQQEQQVQQQNPQQSPLSGELYAKDASGGNSSTASNASGSKEYDPRPRRSAPLPPKA